jgi:hypothetical protein
MGVSSEAGAVEGALSGIGVGTGAPVAAAPLAPNINNKAITRAIEAIALRGSEVTSSS